MLAVLVALGAIAAYRWIHTPFNAQLFAAQQSRSIVDSTLRRIRVISATLEAGTNKSQQLRGQVDEISVRLFGPGELTYFLTTLQDIASRTGCIIRSFSFVPGQQSGESDAAADTTGISSKRASMSISGKYESVISMLRALQDYKRRIWIDSLRLQPSDSGFTRLKCDISLTMYSLGDVEAASYE